MLDDTSVTLDELAGFLGVNSRNLKTLVARGVITRAKPGAYPLRANIRAYCENLRESAAGRAHVNVGSGLAVERERETRERADDILRLLRARFLAMPGRVQQRLAHLTPHDVATIDREIRDVLTEISDDPI